MGISVQGSSYVSEYVTLIRKGRSDGMTLLTAYKKQVYGKKCRTHIEESEEISLGYSKGFKILLQS